MADKSEGLFRRLTLLFRSGPVIKRRVRDFDKGGVTSSAFDMFRKNQSHVYSTAMSAYGTYDRMARYSDFSEMEYTPEISSALDIYSEESVAADEKGSVLHIHSENPTIKKILSELFYDTINVEFNLSAWVRTLCKYGDFFLFNDVSPEHGVINAYPMPVNEVEREEGFDPKDPMAVRYRWVTQGNQVLENWQVTHMRVLANDAFLPYGTSVLESARRIWRQLILVEDAMLVYRVVRSPERRVFYVDVGNVPPEDIPNYMEQVQSTLKKASVVNKDSGRVDLRYNPLSVDEDYYLPVRGGESGTKIDTLAGGQNATAIEDVEYIQKKLFAALKIPKAYLGYDEGLGAKATLSQEDIRFSRTIARIQRTIVAEMNKIAIIHLYCNGFEGEDLLDFTLQLSNPSTIAQQQKLELYRSRFEIAGTAAQVEGLVDKTWLRKNLFSMTDDEISAILAGRILDKQRDLEVEAVQIPEEAEAGLAIAPGEEPPEAPEEEAGLEAPPTELAGDDRNSLNLNIVAGDSIDESDDLEDAIDLSRLSIEDEGSPIKAQNRVNLLAGVLNEDIDAHIDDSDIDVDVDIDVDIDIEPSEEEEKRKRRRNSNNQDTDHLRLVSHDPKNASDSIAHPYARKLTKYKRNSERKSDINPLSRAHKLPKLSELQGRDFLEILDDRIETQSKMTGQMRSALKSLESRIGINSKVISETTNSSEED